MASIEISLSKKVDPETNRQELMLRFFHGKTIDQRAKTGIYIQAKYLFENEIRVRENLLTPNKVYHEEQRAKLVNLKIAIETAFQETDKTLIEKTWLKSIVEAFNHPDRADNKNYADNSLIDNFDLFLKRRNLSEARNRGYRVLVNALLRYNCFRKIYEGVDSDITVSSLNKDLISDFESFVRNENSLFSEYRYIFDEMPTEYKKGFSGKGKDKRPSDRSENTICSLLKKMRAFCIWCADNGKLSANPFKNYDHSLTEHYGTPFYITLEERDKIANFDLSNYPRLAAQRDIFIFQCLIGCRVSDLLRLTSESIVNGEVQYIPRKTADNKPFVVSVPLNSKAESIVSKYMGKAEKGLLPFVNSQQYNEDIRDIFYLCGITRTVTVRDRNTGEQKQVPINEIASSHLARRTFIGNLYKKVKDPNLIGKLSGHAEGSKAFARYRDIDSDIKKELVNLID